MITRWRAALASLEGDKQTSRLLDIGVLLTGGLASFFVFARVPVHGMTPGFQGEFRNHSTLLAEFDTDGSSLYSLWYVFQKLLVGDNRETVVLLNAGWLLLGGLAVIKGLMLTGVLMATSFARFHALAFGLLLGCAVAFPVPFLERRSRLREGPINYLGTLPPNVFMSATQLIANTTAVAAVVTISLWYRRPTTARFISLTLTCVVATLSKPGIAPPLLATIALLTILAYRAGRQNLRVAVIRVAIAGVLIGVPLLTSYASFMAGRGRLGLHSELRPFATWTAFTSQWLPDLIGSWAFPLAVVATLTLTRNATPTRVEWLLPAWSLAIVATLMFALLVEVNREGEVIYAGNFAWGAMAATSGLYVVSLIAIRDVPLRLQGIPLLVLCVQAITGVLYVNNYIKTGLFV